jgi:diguanylate cyclase (GGDEF)-like protein
VNRWRLPLPGGNLNRIRLAALVYCGVATVSQLGQMGNPLRSAGYLRVATACLILVFVTMVVTYVRGRANGWTVVGIPLLVSVGGSGLREPIATIAISLSCLAVLALYGSTRRYCAQVVGALISVPAALAITPFSGSEAMSWHAPAVLAVLPQILAMGVLSRGIYVGLTGQERASARESVLARAGRAMLGVTDVERVREIGRDAAAELVALHPAIVVLVLSRDSGRTRVVSVAGGPADLFGCALSDPVAVDAEQLSLLLPGVHDWHVDPLGTDPAVPDRYLAVGARRHVPADALAAFRTLSHQMMLAKRSCLTTAELDHRAHHDHLTELPTRAKFRQALEAALAGDSATVALLSVDLDNFKEVNDGFGHASGDELLMAIAGRLTAVCTGHDMAARLGGDEFALLLTGLTGARDAELLAERLLARLSEPIELSAATVTVGASIGVAVAEPGSTPADLARRSDIAMYAAKRAGKNCVETYREASAAAA